MSQTTKTFATFFALLALAAAGHDIYLWQTTGFPFAFAALGWLTKNYAPDQHQAVVDFIGAETFNMILTPVLRIPAFFLTAGLAIMTVGIGAVRSKMARGHTDQPRKRPPSDRFARSK